MILRGAWVTFRKELWSYCVSPISWAIAFLFYLWRGFELQELIRGYSYYRGDLDQFPTATYGQQSTAYMVLFVPALLTMRCFAEERRTGSIETLMTAPVTDAGVVFGKWCAAAAFYGLLWLPSVLVLHVLEYGPFLASDLAFGPVAAAYLGMFLLSSMLLAFGVFASSLTDNVLLSAVLAFLVSLGLLTLPQKIASQVGTLAQNYYVRELLEKLDVMRNFGEWFARGLIDTSQVMFYIGGILFFLFLTTVSLSSRRIA
ncbi:MAG: ABC transporter permease subunit [Planctomycetes bacterium]|nr:ABC transporter permease subunit [Planctomycetota bacterium]